MSKLDTDARKVSTNHSVGMKLHRVFQEILLVLQLPYQQALNIIFQTIGTSRYFIVRSRTGDYQNARLYEQLAEIIRNAIEIKMSLGEMGHRLVDDPRIQEAFVTAYLQNNATIEITHGPRVDPDTRHVFELSKRGVIRLYTTPQYSRRHFLLAKNRRGEVAVMDEGVHNEALWRETANGTPQQFYTSRYRIYYVRKKSHRLASKLDRQFVRRRQSAKITDPYHPPSYSYPYRHPLRRVWFFGFLNVPMRWFIQPVEALLDLSVRNPYENSATIDMVSNKVSNPEIKPELSRPAQIALFLAKHENSLELLFLLMEQQRLNASQIEKQFAANKVPTSDLEDLIAAFAANKLIDSQSIDAETVYSLSPEGKNTAEKLLSHLPK